MEELAPLSAPRGAVALATAGGLIHAIGGRIIGEENTLAIHAITNTRWKVLVQR